MIWVVNFLFIVATRGFHTRLMAGLGLGWRETSWNDVLLEPPRRRGVWRKAVRLIFPSLDLQPTRVLLGLTSTVSCVTCYLVLWFCRPHASNPLSHTSSIFPHISLMHLVVFIHLSALSSQLLRSSATSCRASPARTYTSEPLDCSLRERGQTACWAGIPGFDIAFAFMNHIHHWSPCLAPPPAFIAPRPVSFSLASCTVSSFRANHSTFDVSQCLLSNCLVWPSISSWLDKTVQDCPLWPMDLSRVCSYEVDDY